LGVYHTAPRIRAANLYRRAQRLVALGDYSEALPLLSRAIELHPRLHLAYVLRSRVLRQLGFIDHALADAEEAARRAPGDRHSHVARARLLDEFGQRREAMEALQRALQYDPAWLPGYLDLAMHHMALGDAERSLGVLGQLSASASARDPLLYDALVLAGRVYEANLGDFDTAVMAYSRAITLAPERKTGYLVRAWALRTQGDYHHAAEDLVHAAQCAQHTADQSLLHRLQSQEPVPIPIIDRLAAADLELDDVPLDDRQAWLDRLAVRHFPTVESVGMDSPLIYLN
jgi:tetratricopeptide (TPR) repeat protein